MQSASQLALSPPSSQSSPAVAFVTPSPHIAAVQSASQLALSPPSSQVSPAVAFATPSPHITAVQSASHVALSPPSSQSSPASTTPLPHCSGSLAITRITDPFGHPEATTLRMVNVEMGAPAPAAVAV